MYICMYMRINIHTYIVKNPRTAILLAKRSYQPKRIRFKKLRRINDVENIHASSDEWVVSKEKKEKWGNGLAHIAL